MLFEQCPRLYKDRYIDGLTQAPSLAMLFGQTVHTALEAMHQGHRGTRPILPGQDEDSGPDGRYATARSVYDAQFDGMSEALRPTGAIAPASLYTEGLRMLDQVAELRLNADGLSEPEHWFSLPTGGQVAYESAADRNPNGMAWGLPTVGAVDLWSPPWSQHGPVVFDFKTTVGAWTAERVQKERWQPMLYSWAYRRAYDVIPTFKYVVLNRMTGTLEMFDRGWWTKREWNDDLAQLQFYAREIAVAVTEGRFSCNRGHGTCLECGKPYGHDHVCAEGSRPSKIKLAKRPGQTWVQPAFDLA